MAYTAQQLITESWFLSGIVARNLQEATGDQISNGLQMLNNLLNFQQIKLDLIPYWQYIQLNTVVNQEYYTLPYVAAVESVTFNIGVVRYTTDVTSRTRYFGTVRVDNVASLPFNFNFNRELGGGVLSLYFLPESVWPLKMMAKIFLTNVTLQQDLTNITNLALPYTFVYGGNQGYDTSYIEYLRYALARYMCSEYGISFNPQSEEILRSMEYSLMDVSPPDMSNQKRSILNSVQGSGINWGDINLGLGWRPN